MTPTIEQALRSRIQELEQFINAHRPHHYYCEDCWYSCPLAQDGCCDDNEPEDKCNCGAAENIVEIDKVLGTNRRPE